MILNKSNLNKSILNNSMEQGNGRRLPADPELYLDNLLHAYRDACPDADASANFMPELWAKIEARQVSSNVFSRMARALVTVALAATVILGLMVSTASQANSNFNGSYLEALTADHVSTLEPLNLERIAEMEQQ